MKCKTLQKSTKIDRLSSQLCTALNAAENAEGELNINMIMVRKITNEIWNMTSVKNLNAMKL